MNKFILTLNCGSSSIKFSIVKYNNIKNKYFYGFIESINDLNSNIKIYNKDNKIIENIKFNYKINYVDSINNIFIFLEKYNILNNLLSIGHRVVHGGEHFKHSKIIENNDIDIINKLSCFSPIHNPINLLGIKESIKKLPNLKNISVFDTSFYINMPEYSYLYAIPYEFYSKYKIRRYGAHGLSHRYILHKCSIISNKNINDLNIISCHLGNGSSICAIKKGKPIDISMGLTPLEGLVMGSRSGDIDPSIIFYLHNKLNFSIKDIENILINKSGLLGLTNISNDLRIIEDNYIKNDKMSITAINIFCYRLIKYIGSYITILNNDVDYLVFTGGIGENSSLIRKIVLEKLSLFSIFIDNNKNDKNKNFYYKIITKDISKIKSIIIKSNEEYIIANDVINLI